MTKAKTQQQPPLRIGIWMEYFPDWLVSFGHDGISRLIGYLLSGFEDRTADEVEFVFWGPTFAQDKINDFVETLHPNVKALCRVATPSHANPFEGRNGLPEFVAAPRRALTGQLDLELSYILELVSNGEFIYNRGDYEFNVRSDFVLCALEANSIGDVDVWYVPAPRFCHASLLEAPVVLAFPDYVYREFPRIYHTDHNPHMVVESTTFEIMATAALAASDRVLTFHGHVQLDSPEWRVIKDPKERTAFCANQLRSYIHKSLVTDTLTEEKELLLEYMGNVPWDDTNFVFFPTALRPYKNILSVVTAIRILKEERNFPCRLVTTANISVEKAGTDEIGNYIIDNELIFDVLCLPGIPDAVLTSLYSLATASIAPSYFEGGFPFMVTEALSVDTPVVIGDIPVAREIFGDRTQEFPFFDVHDPVAIADAIEAICTQSNADRTALIAKQRKLFAPVVDRSWADAGTEYEAHFRAAAVQAASSKET